MRSSKLVVQHDDNQVIALADQFVDLQLYRAFQNYEVESAYNIHIDGANAK